MLKDQIQKIIKGLEEQMAEEIQRRQDNEIEINDAVSDFAIKLESEVMALEAHKN